jgi:hypothetical protein
MVLDLCKDGGELNDKYFVFVLFFEINLVWIWKMLMQLSLN